MNTEHYKKSKAEITKMQKRYDNKFSEYFKLTMEELRERYKNKMSRTDRLALQDAALYLKEQELKKSKESKVVTEDDSN